MTNDGSFKIKVRIGENEFDAEGPAEVVERQLDAFKELVREANARPMAGQPLSPRAPISLAPSTFELDPVPDDGQGEGGLALERMFKHEGRVVSLTALPDNVQDALLLILLGQKHFRNNDSITGSEIKDGLELSGYRLDRIDRMVDKFDSEGMVMKSGFGKATRYRLTNVGFSQAQKLAKEVTAKLA